MRTILVYRLNGTDYRKEFTSMQEAETYVVELLQLLGGEQIERLSLEEGEECSEPSSES